MDLTYKYNIYWGIEGEKNLNVGGIAIRNQRLGIGKKGIRDQKSGIRKRKSEMSD